LEVPAQPIDAPEKCATTIDVTPVS
jgi:hypothetical protein